MALPLVSAAVEGEKRSARWLGHFWFILQVFAVYLVLSTACFLMLRTTANYTAFRDDVQFLVFKQAYIHNPVWKAAFYVHVFSAVVALFAGFTQFSSQFLKDHRTLHRRLGTIYVFNILIINFPAGMVLAVYANGQLPGRIAFVLLDCLWFFFTCRAYLRARNRNFTGHKADMTRSYALTFSAITLRSWKFALSRLLTIDPVSLYIIDAWLGFIPNLLVAEWIIRRRKR